LTHSQKCDIFPLTSGVIAKIRKEKNMRARVSVVATVIFLVLTTSIQSQEEFMKFSINQKDYNINTKNLKKYDSTYVRLQSSGNSRHSYWISAMLVGENEKLVCGIELYLPKNKGKHVESGRDSYLQEALLNVNCPGLPVNPQANGPNFSTQNNAVKAIDQGELVLEYDVINNLVIGTFEAKIHLYKGQGKYTVVLERNAIIVKGSFSCKVP
jgi:hypothetical protein